MGARDLLVLMRSGGAGAGNMATIILHSYFLERSGWIIVIVATYEAYANVGAGRVLGPGVVVELLAVAPVSGFSRSIC